MPSINIHAHCTDLEAAQAILDSLGTNATWFSFTLTSDDPELPDEDLTPPEGISRPNQDLIDEAALKMARGES